MTGMKEPPARIDPCLLDAVGTEIINLVASLSAAAQGLGTRLHPRSAAGLGRRCNARPDSGARRRRSGCRPACVPVPARGRRRRSAPPCPTSPASHISSGSPQPSQAWGHRRSVRSAFSGSVRHFPLAPGCLPGLRPPTRGGFPEGMGAAALAAPGALPAPPTTPPPPVPNGGSEDGGRELLVEFIANRSAKSVAMV